MDDHPVIRRSDSDQREEAVFEAALQLQGAERTAYPDQACIRDPALRTRIEGLLAALEHAGGLLNEPAMPAKAALDWPRKIA